VSSFSGLSKAGVVASMTAEFTRASELFPRMAERMSATLQHVGNAVPPRHFTPPVAALGKAASLDYRAAFFAKYPELSGKVVVHHAVEQQALIRYPGLFSEAEIHSVENLRGIPLDLNARLHNSLIKKEWNEFYRLNPAKIATRHKLLD